MLWWVDTGGHLAVVGREIANVSFAKEPLFGIQFFLLLTCGESRPIFFSLLPSMVGALRASLLASPPPIVLFILFGLILCSPTYVVRTPLHSGELITKPPLRPPLIRPTSLFLGEIFSRAIEARGPLGG